MEFDLTRDVPIPTHCPVLGIPLRRGGIGDGSSPSVDRIDNQKGYVPGNVRVVSLKAKRVKNDATVGELRALANFYARLNRQRAKGDSTRVQTRDRSFRGAASTRK